MKPCYFEFAEPFQRLFWIIFDPGQEELTDIGAKSEEKTVCCSTPKPTTISFARPAPGVPVATLNPDADTTFAHNVGIYIWGFYQVNIGTVHLVQLSG